MVHDNKNNFNLSSFLYFFLINSYAWLINFHPNSVVHYQCDEYIKVYKTHTFVLYTDRKLQKIKILSFWRL